MTNEKKSKKLAETLDREASNNRATSQRRKNLKKLTVASGVVAAGLGHKWTKPAIESALLPAHATTSQEPVVLGTLTGRWFLGDDAVGGYDAGISGTVSVTDGFLYDDGTDANFEVTVSPPQAIPVTIDFSVAGTTFAGFDGAAPSIINTNAGGTGTAGPFGPDANSDFGDSPGTGSIVVTFSSPGFVSSVVTLNVS